MPLIACIPNVSEGRRTAVVEGLAATVRQTPGVRLLDYSFDPSHNRSVFTFVGAREAVKAAVLALVAGAVAAIDLRDHRGEHPRMGAVDVVPFVPIEGVTMAECVALAREVGAAVAQRFGIPVFLYEEASRHPARRNLADIRRGGFEGLANKMTRPEWTPDFGASTPHETAGACAVGARMPLIAYNINLNTDRLEVARTIARTIRESGGGLPHVKAIGVRLEGRPVVQVSTNLTNYRKTPIHEVFDLVVREAERHGVTVVGSEIIGLVPSAALLDAAAHYLRLEAPAARQILEDRLKEPAALE